MKKLTRNVLWGILLTIGLTSIAGGAMAYHYLFARNLRITGTTYLYVDRNDDTDSLCHKLAAIGAPEVLPGFRFLARQGKYANHIRTGRYAVQPDDNARSLYRRLSRGYQSPMMLTVPSTRTIGRMIRTVTHQLMIDSTEIARLLTDTACIANMGYTPETLPSLFLPNTYEVYWNLSADDFLKRMQREHETYWNAERRQKAEAVGLTPEEVSTLASIVDEETTDEAEKPVVAGLYLNRLRRGMLLQADPTVKFATGDPGLRRVLLKHLEIRSPYNTYLHTGLPPGPIRIPTLQALESVLEPARHDYLYMCAKEDFSGTHRFAATLSEHAANARRYQQELNRRRIR